MVYTTIHSRWCLGQQQCICCCPSLSDTATYNFRVINRKLKQLVGQQNDFSLLLLLLLFLLNSETTNYRVGMWIAAISVCAKKHINISVVSATLSIGIFIKRRRHAKNKKVFPMHWCEQHVGETRQDILAHCIVAGTPSASATPSGTALRPCPSPYPLQLSLYPSGAADRQHF